jgi:hypothetical protein
MISLVLFQEKGFFKISFFAYFAKSGRIGSMFDSSLKSYSCYAKELSTNSTKTLYE